MDREFRRRYVRKVVPGVVIVLSAAAVFLFWKTDVLNLSVATEEGAAGQTSSPAVRSRKVIKASLAGTGWYDDDPQALSRQLEGFFDKARIETIDNVIAFILPHAGYDWSGQTAAFALKATKKNYNRIVVIGPSHRTYMEEILSVPRGSHYETPLGKVPLDAEFIEELLKFSVFQDLPYALDNENSVEMEVPLLQYWQKDFKLVLIVAGQCSLPTVRKAGRILRGLVDEDTLVVASSDFVHYGRGHRYVPFTENIPERIKELDMGAYEYIAKKDAKGFLDYRSRTGATICGTMSIAVLLSMLDAGTTAHLAKYTRSGELTGDYSNSVSYLSVVFSGRWSDRPEAQPEQSKLTEEDKKRLLSLARKSILYYLENKALPEAAELNITVSGAMESPRAAFVTLKKESRLRGCIGDIFPQRPLYKSVIYNAVSAAVRDRRFPPVTRDECKDLTIEISALTAPQPVESPNDIRIGTDGVVLKKDGRSAVYLPQVAPEQGWGLNETLSNLSLKAGLPADAWKEGASFLVFQATVFGEEE